MFSAVKSTLNLKLKCTYFISNYSRKIHCLAYPVHRISFNQHNGKSSFQKTSSTDVRLCRHFSFTALSDTGESFYKYITTSEPSIQLKNFLIEFHDMSGMPWWATIILFTAIVRIGFSFPLGIYQQHLMTRLNLCRDDLKVEMQKVVDILKLNAKRGKWSRQKQRSFLMNERKKIWNDLVIKRNCHPLKPIILSWAQIPVWVLLSLSFRSLVDINPTNSVPYHTRLELLHEGVLWSTNLMVPDSTSILPLIFFLNSWALIEINTFSVSAVGTLISKFLMFFLRLLSILTFLIGLYVPSSVCLYWATSTFLALCQTLFLMSPKVRKFLQLPIAPRGIQNPYKNLIAKIKEKYTFKKKRDSVPSSSDKLEKQ